MCQDCFRSLSETPSTLCITRDIVCVCVYVCVCLPFPAPPTTHCDLPMFIAQLISLEEKNAYMCQDCFRSLPEAPSTLCITRDTVCVCLCVFAIACSPHPPLRPHDAHSLLVNSISGGATPTCVKIASAHCPRLHPPCVSRGTLCVCVSLCVFAITCSSNPTLRSPDEHSPSI